MSDNNNTTTENNDKVTAKTVLEDYNPVHQVFSSISKEIGVEFPLDSDDYLSLISAGLSMVPVVGDLVSSVFGIIWGKFFPAEEKYVSKEAFEKRISQLYKDMEKKMNAKLDSYAADWCNAKYRALLKGGELFKEAINVYIATKKQGTYSGFEKTKVAAFIIANHAVFTNSLNESLIFFSNANYVRFTIKLYLETAAIYLAFLKDSIVMGKDWGLPAVYVDGSFGVKSLQQKVHDATSHIFSTFKLFIQQTNKAGVGAPNWSLLVSAYAHGDYTMYPNKVSWLKRHNEKYGVTSFLLPSDVIKPHIFSIDATQVGIMCEGLYQIYSKDRKVDGQICDYVTGTNDYSLVKGDQRKKTLIYFTLYESVQRTLSFRFFLSNIEKNYNDFNLIVRELDPSKVDQTNKPGYHPDDAFRIKLKEHTQKMKNSKPYPSPFHTDLMDCYSSDPITFESSKIYYVEFISSTDINLGSYYHRIDIFGGAATDKQGYEEGDRPMVNINEPSNPDDSLIDFAKLGAEYAAMETSFAAQHPIDTAGNIADNIKDGVSNAVNDVKNLFPFGKK